MDFAALTNEQTDALEGYQREAWYAWRRGDQAKVAEIFACYEGKPAVAPAAPAEPADTPEVEAAYGPAVTETAVAPRPRRQPRKA